VNVTPQGNGRIKVTLPQALSLLALLGAIGGSWYDTRTQILLARQEIQQLRLAQDKLEERWVQHERLHGHAGVMERVDGVEVRLQRLER
jgi:hypothetical protein